MPTVIFEASHSKPLEIDVPEGGSLADVCDAKNAPVPFSCRSASCGTCCIDVKEGAELLLPAEDEELDILDMLAAPKTHRLACQAVMKPGPGRLRVVPQNEY